MAIFLLDTSVIVDAINGKRGRDQFLDELLQQRNLLACCCINVTEVYAGMRTSEAKVTEALLRSLKFYEVTWEIARRAGELKSEWAKKGHTLALPDVTIAAVALAHDLTLVTDNRKHFPMPGLRLLALPEVQ
ncbi:MAG TPA: type II toxin-antitoxin system VapC family toxin [Bryobacteraceae bacterium]|nr:type II toxin-antitoxin system VapC family toxin [Bryobacteraceae bacterium]